MKHIALLILLSAVLFSCNETGTDSTSQINADEKTATVAASGLRLDVSDNPELTFKNLRLYPVLADAGLLENNRLPILKTLAEAMQTHGFRITERKQFGREQETWYNGLTVQNKSADPVFLMAGDVVTGGNQDRVIAHDDVIQPASLKNIEVFCVEAGRSTYYNPAAPESEKQVAAFKGYYNVASPQVRKAVYSGNQQGVWGAVGKVTEANNATSSTQTYAALETENAKKEQREACLRFFEGKFDNLPDAVGVVAVCDGKVVGVDVFGHPKLFRRQFKALLHGFAAETAFSETTKDVPGHVAEAAFRQVVREADKARTGTEAVGKFSLGDAWVHLYSK
ncbi:MAG: hypothetical protein JNJ90_15930 [Saprospiraceae bacterium]|nr:hypothetical protein [Saprospiraceae bacterium]